MDLTAIAQAVDMQGSLFLESLQWKLEQGELTSMQDVHRFLEETCLDDTAALGLSLEDQLYLLENYAEDEGFELGEVKIRDLRRSLETLAVQVIHRLAEARVLEVFQELESFLERYDFELSDLRFSNPFGWVRPSAERSETCHVYEYRNVEGEVHVDVWKLCLLRSFTVYFERYLGRGRGQFRREEVDAT